MNSLLFIIIYLTMFAWILPPLKQYHTKFFLYFLLLAASDPLGSITSNLWLFNIWEYYFLFSTLTILSLIQLKNAKTVMFISAVIIITIAAFIEMNVDTMHNMVAFNILLTAVIISRLFVMNIRETEKVDLFFIVLILYNISNVIKIIFSVSHGKTGYLYFFLTNIFQIFIAIYFTVYNVENSKKFSLFRDLTGKA